MSAQDSISAYFQSTAVGASAVGQVVALYDTILRDLRRATEALASNQVEKRIDASNHAIMVIGELQGVLDFERGGEVANTLSSFYSVVRAMISQAATHGSLKKFNEIIGMVAQLRAAWCEVERTIAPAEPTQQLRISARTTMSSAQDASDPSEKAEPPSKGSWSA
jgi:flagellar secretion chaperone FliS